MGFVHEGFIIVGAVHRGMYEVSEEVRVVVLQALYGTLQNAVPFVTENVSL